MLKNISDAVWVSIICTICAHLRFFSLKDYTWCCHGYRDTSIMMSWIIEIGLFSLLSLWQLIYAWVPRGRLQLSFHCLNPGFPVLGNKPAMIINQRQDFLSTKIEIQIMPDLWFSTSMLYFSLSSSFTARLSLSFWSCQNMSGNCFFFFLCCVFISACFVFVLLFY